MTGRIRNLLTRRKAMIVAAILFVSSAAIFGLVHLSHRSSTIPAFEVKREEFVDSVQFRGEVKAMKSLSISAPAEAGELQILKIATSGVDVKKGDLIVEFDKSKTEQDMAQDRSALKSAQAAIDQVRAQSRLTEEEDMTAVTKAQYDVEVAKLDASKQEIVSKIEGAEANLKVANAQQKLHEVEEKLKSDRAVIHANVDSKLDASKKAAYDLERAQRSLATMTLVAPSSGLVNLVSVWHVGNRLRSSRGRGSGRGRRSPNYQMFPLCGSRREWTKRSVAVLQPTNPRPFNWMRFLSGSLAASSNRSAPSPPWISPQAGPYPEISISRSRWIRKIRALSPA